VVVVGRRQREPLRRHRRPVRRLAGEHVELAGEARAGVEPPAGRGRAPQHARVGEVVVGQRPPGQEPDHQHPELGPVVEHLRTRAGLERGAGVVVLGVAVDAEQRGVAAAAPDDVHAVRGDDLDVAVGEPARKVLDQDPAGEPWHLVEDVLQAVGHAGGMPATSR
jgi:hypothetical protein